MRKGQIKIIQNAEYNNLAIEEINFLSREDYTLPELEICYNYFLGNMQYTNFQDLIDECEYFMPIIRKSKNNSLYYVLKYILLPYHDKLIKEHQQKEKIYKFAKFYETVRSNGYFPEEPAYNIYAMSLQYNMSMWQTTILLKTIFYQQPEIAYKLLCNEKVRIDFLENNEKSLFYYLFDVCINYKNILFPGLFSNLNCRNHFIDILYDLKEKTNASWDKYFIINEKDDMIYIGHTITLNYQYMVENSEIEQNDIYYLLYNKINYPFSIEDLFSNYVNFINYNSYNPYNNYNHYYKLDLVNDEENYLDKKYNECSKILKKEFEVKQNSNAVSIKFLYQNKITIRYEYYKNLKIKPKQYNEESKSEDVKYVPQNKALDYEIVIFNDNGKLSFYYLHSRNNSYYNNSNKGKLIPLPFKEFCFLYTINFPELHDILDIFFQDRIKKNPLYKDLLQDYLDVSQTIPISFDEIDQYHNKAELLKSRYKDANNINIKWNKQNIFLSYMIIKTWRKVIPGKSQQILLQQKDISLVKNLYGNIYSKINQFVVNILEKQIIKNTPKEQYRKEFEEIVGTKYLEEEYEQYLEEHLIDDNIDGSCVQDYIEMCTQAKRKFNLTFVSLKKILKVHDEISNTMYKHRTKTVKIPSNSKFNDLRKILPENFEQITTKKRLIMETEIQHHCVWSYASDISHDQCAIYSFLDSDGEKSIDDMPKRYTIEFRQDPKTKLYYIQQIQGKYNRRNTQKMYSYVQNILDQAQIAV